MILIHLKVMEMGRESGNVFGVFKRQKMLAPEFQEMTIIVVFGRTRGRFICGWA